uniref:C2 domain-containing protein n=1 Tax=Macrostomum lignano TaxID=282301 RepID=A0A1I8F3E7_9PLAT
KSQKKLRQEEPETAEAKRSAKRPPGSRLPFARNVKTPEAPNWPRSTRTTTSSRAAGQHGEEQRLGLTFPAAVTAASKRTTTRRQKAGLSHLQKAICASTRLARQSSRRPSPRLPSLFTLHKDLPSNNPVSVLVRVYIVRCENYIPKQLNPVFGKCFELEAKFPQDSGLQLLVMDWEICSPAMTSSGRPGSTWRTACTAGTEPPAVLPIEYSTFGYNDGGPAAAVNNTGSTLAAKTSWTPPKYEPAYSRVTVDGRTFYEHSEVEDEAGNKTQSNEPLALKVLNNWDQVTGVALVPEHVESRPLFSPEKPGIEQGRVEMWVDLFPTELGRSPPPQVDISPRQPVAYELRVIIWDTAEVKLDERPTFPFAIDEEERKAPCQLHLQVWDADIVSADDFLGGLDLRLSRLPRALNQLKRAALFQLERDSGVRAISIFRNRRCRGWWPFIGESEDEPGEQSLALLLSRAAPGGGKVDAELQLLTAAEAEANPAGLGRSEPQPLPEPKSAVAMSLR